MTNISAPTLFLVLAFLGAPVGLLVGVLTGAFLAHRWRVGKSPLPDVVGFVKSFKPQKKSEPGMKGPTLVHLKP